MITAIITLLVTVNPAAASASLVRDRRTDRPVPVLAGTGVALVVLAALAAGADQVLDALDVNLGTYLLGAGAAITFSGLRWLVAGAPGGADGPTTDLRLAAFVCFPTLLTPAAAVAAVAVGAEDGFGTALVAAAVAVVVGGLAVFFRRRVPEVVAQGLVRLVGAGAVVVGIAVAIEGIRTL